MELTRYLARIGYKGLLEPDASTLRRLQLAHLRRVPFENLDIGLGRPLSLELQALFDKIVVRRRGGFCYELNGLFAWLLEELGFEVTLLSARDLRPDGDWSPEFDHLTLLVRCPHDPDTRWLADVGYGDSFLEPLRLDEPGEQIQGWRAYRIAPEQGYQFVWQRDQAGEWERQYGFTLQPRRLDEFEPMCRYHQSSPQSIFTQKRLCTLATEDGRITLSGDKFITKTNGLRQEQPVEGEAHFRRILKERFGVELAGA
jgi:N-hydroxyarylamine O-acetyltransferase